MSSPSHRAACLADLRAQSPLIHHITNAVTINDCANITLALGGSPVMADALDESTEMVGFAGALVLNMGTLHPDSVASMIAAGIAARAKGVPVIFDPVGAGATEFRRQTAQSVVEKVRPSVIKGNAAEIRFLAGEASSQRGVDSLDSDAEQAAVALARKTGAIVAATGAVDAITDGKVLLRVTGGTPMLGRITGTGCMTASLVGCFAAVEKDLLTAAALGVLAMNLAGETAEKALSGIQGTGHFRIHLVDAVSRLSPADFPWDARIRRVEL
jgi:hydroxyethylthiazole kinase